MVEAWQDLLRWRRRVEPDDAKPIDDRDTRASIWNRWSAEWRENYLTPKQQRYKTIQQTSIFNAWVRKRYGSKHFLMAMLETGITWAPSAGFLETDRDGVTEHVAQNFATWIAAVMRSIASHKNDAATMEARARSGSAYGQHGLTPQQIQDRKERDDARRNYHWAVELNTRLLVSKGKSTGKGKRQTAAPEPTPKSWRDMTGAEQWWLYELWNGNLASIKKEAERKHGGKVQAKDFTMSS